MSRGVDPVLGADSPALSRLEAVRRTFRAFRRTRPFWGGLWLLVGGWLVLRLSMVPAHIAVAAGCPGSAGG